MEIKILGSGCSKCEKLADLTKEVAEDLGIDINMEKVSDIKDIMAMGVMTTPGLVVNGEVKASGRLPKKDEIKKYLEG